MASGCGPVKQPGPTAQPGDGRSPGCRQGPGPDGTQCPWSLGASAGEGNTRSSWAQRAWGSKQTAAPHRTARHVTFIRPPRARTQTAARQPAGASTLSSWTAGRKGARTLPLQPAPRPLPHAAWGATHQQQEGTGGGEEQLACCHGEESRFLQTVTGGGGSEAEQHEVHRMSLSRRDNRRQSWENSGEARRIVGAADLRPGSEPPHVP